MRTNLRTEIEGKFSLNEIQREAIERVGKNLIVDAPTASGKTEAILLSISEGSKVTWMLPTISACTFMYRRLCHDFENLNIRVSTSVMEEERFVSNDFTTITIITCDPMMVEYVKSVTTEGKGTKTTDEVLVLDEIDNYPTKVRTVLKHYIKNVDLKQVLLASATLDEELKDVKSDFEVIKFSKISNKIRYKVETIDYYDDIVKNVIIPNYKKKKIGVILNSISEMETLSDFIKRYMKLNCMEDMNIIYHHSGLANEIKFENERRLFTKEYELLISNDLISTSVDVDLDILIMGWSDKLNMKIQRMGRLNRRGKKVNFTNLYVLDKDSYPVFIDEDVANDLLRRLGLRGLNPIRLITSDKIADWSNQVILDNISFEDVVEEVNYNISKGEEVVLRDIPKTFRYTSIETIQKRKKGDKIKAVRKTLTVDKKMNNIPWTYYDPCSQEDGVRDLLYMPWMFDTDHPNGVHSNIWKIDDYDKENGIRYISPYDGPQYPVVSNEEDGEDNIESNSDCSKSSELSIDSYSESSLDIRYHDPDDYDYECDSLYVVDYSDSSFIVDLATIKNVIVDLLQFSNKLSEYQKWSPFSNKDTIYRRANVVLEKVFEKYNIDDSIDWMRSVSNELYKNPDLINDKLISTLFWVNEDDELFMNKEWLGIAKPVKQFIIKEIEQKVENFDRSKLFVSQTDYIVKEYDGNHIVRGVRYADKLYLFSSYPDYFTDCISDNDLNLIEDVREVRSGYSREEYFPLNDRTMKELMWGTKDFIVGQYNINSINKTDVVLNELLEYCNKYSNTKSLDPFIIKLHSTFLIEDFFNTTGEKYNSDMVLCTKISELHKRPDGKYYISGKYLDGLNQVLRVGKTKKDEDGLGYNLMWLSIHNSMKEFILNNCVKDIEEKYSYVEFDKFEFTYNVIKQDDYKDDIHEPITVKYKDLEWKVSDDVKFEYTGDISFSTVRKDVVKRYVYGDGLYSDMCSTNYTKNKTKDILTKQGVKLLLDQDGYEVHAVIERLLEIHKEESKPWGTGVGYLQCDYAYSSHFESHEGKVLRRLYEETGATVKDILETVAYNRAHDDMKRIEGNYSWYYCLDKLLNESNICNNITFNSYYLSLPYSIVEFVENIIISDLKEKYGKDYYLQWNKLRHISGMKDGKPDMIIGMSYEVDKDQPWLKYYLSE